MHRIRLSQALAAPVVAAARRAAGSYFWTSPLWEAPAEWLPEGTVGILELLPVTPRLWKAAPGFCQEGSAAAETFVRERRVGVLHAKASGVIRALREMAAKRG